MSDEVGVRRAERLELVVAVVRRLARVHEHDVVALLEALAQLLDLEEVVGLLRDGVVAGGVAEGVARDHRGVLQQQPHELLVSGEDGEVERRVALAVGGVDVGAHLDHEQCRLLGTVGGTCVERRAPVVIDDVDEGGVGEEALRHRLHLRVRRGARQVERRAAARVGGAARHPAVDEPVDQLGDGRRRLARRLDPADHRVVQRVLPALVDRAQPGAAVALVEE